MKKMHALWVMETMVFGMNVLDGGAWRWHSNGFYFRTLATAQVPKRWQTQTDHLLGHLVGFFVVWSSWASDGVSTIHFAHKLVAWPMKLITLCLHNVKPALHNGISRKSWIVRQVQDFLIVVLLAWNFEWIDEQVIFALEIHFKYENGGNCRHVLRGSLFAYLFAWYGPLGILKRHLLLGRTELRPGFQPNPWVVSFRISSRYRFWAGTTAHLQARVVHSKVVIYQIRRW